MTVGAFYKIDKETMWDLTPWELDQMIEMAKAILAGHSGASFG